MDYEEKIIDGVICFRISKTDEWRQLPKKELTERIVVRERTIDDLSARMAELQAGAAEMQGRAYLDGKQYEKDRISELLGLS